MRLLSILRHIAVDVTVMGLLALNMAVCGGVFIGERAINVRRATVPAIAGGGQGTSALTPSERAEVDNTDSLPGRFVPTQGREHLAPYPDNRRIPFCDAGRSSNDCYASNPPTSGLHLPVQANVQLPGGHRLKIPPDPDVYDFPIPREAIPHIEEHAGVYLGYNCSGDACRAAVERTKDIVAQEISLGAKAVMSPDPDLAEDTIGLVAWTRIDSFGASDYSDNRVRSFIKAHSCRFDPEGFCSARSLN
jgi:hypothetical protein